MPPQRKDWRIRFLARVEPMMDDRGCWEWRGALQPNGYGTFGVSPTKNVRAHRASFEIAKGPIPPGLEIDHLCRNRSCCNPAHLEAVTHQENKRRESASYRARVTVCRGGHSFTDPANAGINNRGKRYCRACDRAAYHRNQE
jgi:hypothetical protein